MPFFFALPPPPPPVPAPNPVFLAAPFKAPPEAPAFFLPSAAPPFPPRPPKDSRDPSPLAAGDCNVACQCLIILFSARFGSRACLLAATPLEAACRGTGSLGFSHRASPCQCGVFPLWDPRTRGAAAQQATPARDCRAGSHPPEKIRV